MRLLQGDIIQADSNASIGIVLKDDTLISMGPNSNLTLSSFVFEPKDKRFDMLTMFNKGTFTFFSGMMLKLAPEAVKVRTPIGMIPLRGSHYLIQVN